MHARTLARAAGRGAPALALESEFAREARASHDGAVSIQAFQALPLAGFSGAKTLMLIMVIALPLILIIGTYLRRSRSR